jgi:hypothetical protein
MFQHFNLMFLYMAPVQGLQGSAEMLGAALNSSKKQGQQAYSPPQASHDTSYSSLLAGSTTTGGSPRDAAAPWPLPMPPKEQRVAGGTLTASQRRKGRGSSSRRRGTPSETASVDSMSARSVIDIMEEHFTGAVAE